MNLLNKKYRIYTILGVVILIIVLALTYLLYGNNESIKYSKVITLNDKSIESYVGREVKWQAKISNYYTQISGIKFCIIDSDHKNVDIDKPCDWFWATAKDLMNVDNTSKNPNWSGDWVNTVLEHYKVDFDKDAVYTVRGKVNGLDCGVDDKCRPDIDIVSIGK